MHCIACINLALCNTFTLNQMHHHGLPFSPALNWHTWLWWNSWLFTAGWGETREADKTAEILLRVTTHFFVLTTRTAVGIHVEVITETNMFYQIRRYRWIKFYCKRFPLTIPKTQENLSPGNNYGNKYLYMIVLRIYLLFLLYVPCSCWNKVTLTVT